ncbi:MAG: hypothetical protein V1752_03005, partial [Candidatus Firestonebacteria bacterium]
IRAFYTETALHYPDNLVMLPKMFHVFQIAVGIIFGSLLNGAAISIYNQRLKKMSTRFDKNLKIAFNHYLPLFTYAAAVFVIIYAFERYSGTFINSMLSKNNGYFLKMGQLKWNVILTGSNIGLGILVETLLIYVPVIIILENSGFRKAVSAAIKICSRYFTVTFLMVFVPVLLYLVVDATKMFIPRLMLSLFPEISLIIVLAGIIAAFLVNTVIAVSSTVLYLAISEPPKEKLTSDRTRTIVPYNTFVNDTPFSSLPKETDTGTGRRGRPRSVKTDKKEKAN